MREGPCRPASCRWLLLGSWMWPSAPCGARQQHRSNDTELRGAERLGRPLPPLLSPKASCRSRDPRGAGVNACCVFRSWDGGLPAQRPAPRFYQTFQRVFLFAWKPNKHLNVQNGLRQNIFLRPSPVVEAARGYHSHCLETSLFNTFIARTETSTQGSAQHRHGTSRGRLPGGRLHPGTGRLLQLPERERGTRRPAAGTGQRARGGRAPPGDIFHQLSPRARHAAACPGLALLQCCPGLASGAGAPFLSWELQEQGH